MSQVTNGRTELRFARAAAVERLGRRMTGVGVLGLAAGAFYRWLTGMPEADQVQSALGAALMWFYAGLFAFGPLVVMQIAALLYRRAERLAGGEGVPPDMRQWQAPRWLAWPLWTITTVGSIVLLYVLIFHSLPAFLTR